MLLIIETLIELKEPFWLQRWSHCSVINLAHIAEPFVAPDGAIGLNGSPRWARLITEGIAPFLEPFGLQMEPE